jgi:hypothetical protein
MAQQPSKDVVLAPIHRDPKSPTGFILTGAGKGVLLCLVLGALYYRVYRRKQNNDKVCSHCGTRNPPLQTNCRKCSAPLFVK